MNTKSLFTVGCVISSMFLASCSSEETFYTASAKEWNENQVRSSIKFVNHLHSVKPLTSLEKSVRSMGDQFDTNIIFTLGRKSRSCDGFGICEIFKPFKPKPITIDNGRGGILLSKKRLNKDNDKGIFTTVEKENGNYFALLLLSEVPNTEIPTEKLNLIVEEELILPLKEKDLYLHSGVITFDKTLGEFGGYKVQLHEKSSFEL